ncbi:bZIP transcription factor domain containing protein [Entamoeba histolytica HM-3:IMSS]|uniref:BZIP transcription factor domain containing protein n=2 Tax=Entamoeba histolytica TaxID=5759 RepID=M2S0F4_ENTHI|nr:bZIP transcription factor domain containing protein [Entamoeba histolytica KU27]EMS12140.1 bZIP transcription factor domain containing protein [Entamoeba histolytica HM-3:IMSS]
MEAPYNPFNRHNESPPSQKSPLLPQNVSPPTPLSNGIIHTFDFTELEKMDLEEFDSYIETVRMKERITGDDEEKLRKLRRRIQNRWSSKMCRDKKRDKINELKEELSLFKQKCEQLEEENKKLKELVSANISENTIQTEKSTLDFNN